MTADDAKLIQDCILLAYAVTHGLASIFVFQGHFSLVLGRDLDRPSESGYYFRIEDVNIPGRVVAAGFSPTFGQAQILAEELLDALAGIPADDLLAA